MKRSVESSGTMHEHFKNDDGANSIVSRPQPAPNMSFAPAFQGKILSLSIPAT